MKYTVTFSTDKKDNIIKVFSSPGTYIYFEKVKKGEKINIDIEGIKRELVLLYAVKRRNNLLDKHTDAESFNNFKHIHRHDTSFPQSLSDGLRIDLERNVRDFINAFNSNLDIITKIVVYNGWNHYECDCKTMKIRKLKLN